MAKTLALPLPLPLPLPQSHNMSQTLLSPCTRIFSSKFLSSHTNISSSIISKTTTKTNNNNNAHVIRRLTSPPTTPLLTIPHTHNIIRSTCICHHISPFSLPPLQRPCSPSLGFSVMSDSHDHGPTIPQDSAKTVRCMIKGRVQGVFYKNWTVENATELGLKGWVRNRRDGSVEALFSGKAEAVDDMLQRCRRGPPDAMVTAFQVNPCTEDPVAGFERRPTV